MPIKRSKPVLNRGGPWAITPIPRSEIIKRKERREAAHKEALKELAKLNRKAQKIIKYTSLNLKKKRKH